jgi:tRNA pseudouridine32 synthase/23S rRNA pseudouridine746 synthase
VSDFELLHSDDALLVVVKPAGLLAVPGRGSDKQDCLVARLLCDWPDARVVHRLDQATSGLMVFARGLAAQRRLGAAFEQRAVRKRYVALVAGRIAAASGLIELPLGADWPNRPRQRVDLEHGRPASTAWRVLARHDDRTRLALEPVTGRTHQLRVHLQAIGHPILGDALYAPPEPACATRLLLHASELALRHPVSGAALQFSSPAPF